MDTIWAGKNPQMLSIWCKVYTVVSTFIFLNNKIWKKKKKSKNLFEEQNFFPI